MSTTAYMDVFSNGAGIQENRDEHKVHIVPRVRGFPGDQKGNAITVVRGGTRAKGKTPRTCPYGAGLTQYVLEHRIVVVFTKKQGMAWVQF